MEKPKINEISESFIPKDSLATTAARVTLGDGKQAVIELFSGDDLGAPDLESNEVDFRGLPPHLEGLTISLAPEAQKSLSERNEQLITALVEYVIGARQHLGDGLTPVDSKRQ